jgi:hypothetical protein
MKIQAFYYYYYFSPARQVAKIQEHIVNIHVVAMLGVVSAV